MALACLCRHLDEDDFDTEAALKARIMRDDFVCGQCQLRYMASFDVWGEALAAADATPQAEP